MNQENCGSLHAQTPPPSPGMDKRAPSPGMDMTSELLEWSQLHGYGDSAEALPDEVVEAAAVEPAKYQLRGVKMRGW